MRHWREDEEEYGRGKKPRRHRDYVQHDNYSANRTPEQTESWINGCLRKKKLQEKWADRTIEKARAEGNYLRKYRCPHCLGWHVTSKPYQPKKER